MHSVQYDKEKNKITIQERKEFEEITVVKRVRCECW